MKKIITPILVLFVFATAIFADVIVAPEKLPQAARDFIGNNFPTAKIVRVEMDDDYDVRLSDGAKIEFRLNGEWKEIKNRNGLAKTILPVAVAQTVDAKFPNVPVIEIEKKRGKFEIKLANRVELLIASDGKLLAQEYDD